jgi:sterol 3beta-glucosyltransferase
MVSIRASPYSTTAHLMKTITLLTSGTRGDVLPYIALGLGLRDAGYQVHIAAPIGFKQLVEPSGLIFAPFEGNPTDLMLNRSEPLTLSRSLVGSIRATFDFLEQASVIYKQMLRAAADACRGSDILIYGLPTLWGAHIAEGLRIPSLRAVLQPITPTRAFSSALLPFRLNFGGLGNWFSHWLVTQITWLAWRSEINYARRIHFELPPAQWHDPSLRPFPQQPITLNGFSEHIVPRPFDWNEKQIITGYWRYSNTHDFSEGQAARIQRFVERSPAKTLAVGLGSPGTQNMLPFINTLDKALKQSEAQAVLTIPNKWHNQFISTRILPVEYVPHEWLYQHVRVAIHHGGAGSTSASLHAGIPTITVPLGIDQFFWGERIYKLEVGTKPSPQRGLNAEKLAKAIQQALGDEHMRERARGIREKLSLEDGVQAAVRVIRNL